MDSPAPTPAPRADAPRSAKAGAQGNKPRSLAKTFEAVLDLPQGAQNRPQRTAWHGFALLAREIPARPASKLNLKLNLHCPAHPPPPQSCPSP
jgi:hypothetical protein